MRFAVIVIVELISLHRFQFHIVLCKPVRDKIFIILLYHAQHGDLGVPTGPG